MNIIQDALNVAAKAHKDQVRKGTDIPYITHPVGVGMLLQQMKCSPDVIAAGILHDTLEDTPLTREDLLTHFGAHITSLVEAASEPDKTLTWFERKYHTLLDIPHCTTDELYVIIADKLHNLQSIRTDIEIHGDSTWDRFNHGYREQRWYYTNLYQRIKDRKQDVKLIRPFGQEIKSVFGSLQAFDKEDIDDLFACAYLFMCEDTEENLRTKGLYVFAKQLIEDAESFYRDPDAYDVQVDMLQKLSAHGIRFQDNSDGPFVLASFCLAIQHTMFWTDEELVRHFKRNVKKL